MNPRHLLAAFAAWVLGVAAVVEIGQHALDRPIACGRAFGPCQWRELSCTVILDPGQREDCAWGEGYRTFTGTLGLMALFLAPIAAVFCALTALKSRAAGWPWWASCAACTLVLVRLLSLGLPSLVF